MIIKVPSDSSPQIGTRTKPANFRYGQPGNAGHKIEVNKYHNISIEKLKHELCDYLKKKSYWKGDSRPVSFSQDFVNSSGDQARKISNKKYAPTLNRPRQVVHNLKNVSPNDNSVDTQVQSIYKKSFTIK